MTRANPPIATCNFPQRSNTPQYAPPGPTFTMRHAPTPTGLSNASNHQHAPPYGEHNPTPRCAVDSAVESIALSTARPNGLHSTTDSSTQRRQVRSSHISYPAASNGIDLPNETSVQRCEGTHPGPNIRDLRSPRAHLPSGISASCLDSPNDHEHPAPDHDGRGQKTITPFPHSVQTGVCPQSRPTFTPQTAVVRVRQSCTAIALAAVIPPNPLNADNAFSEGKEDPPHSSWASSSETPAQVHNTNATADLSLCNGTPAILDKHEACPDRDAKERTRHVTTPSVRTSQPICKHFVPLETTHGNYDASRTYISDAAVLFWQLFRFSPIEHLHHLRWTSSITLAQDSS